MNWDIVRQRWSAGPQTRDSKVALHSTRQEIGLGVFASAFQGKEAQWRSHRSCSAHKFSSAEKRRSLKSQARWIVRKLGVSNKLETATEAAFHMRESTGVEALLIAAITEAVLVSECDRFCWGRRSVENWHRIRSAQLEEENF